MAVETRRFIRKPLYVDAIRVTAANFDAVATWCAGTIHQAEAPNAHKNYIKVEVNAPKNVRQTQAFVGDWILSTERGYKVYTNKAFRAAFDEVTAEAAPLSDARLSGDPVADASLEAEYAAEGERHYPRKVVNEPPHKVVPELTEKMGPITAANATPEQIAAAIMENKSVVRRLRGEGRTDEEIAQRLGLTLGEVASYAEPELEEETVLTSPTAPPVVVPTNGEVTVEDVPEQESVVPAAAEGKHVLSIAEQADLGPDKVRELVQAGDAVLAQDIAQP